MDQHSVSFEWVTQAAIVLVQSGRADNMTQAIEDAIRAYRALMAVTISAPSSPDKSPCKPSRPRSRGKQS